MKKIRKVTMKRIVARQRKERAHYLRTSMGRIVSEILKVSRELERAAMRGH